MAIVQVRDVITYAHVREVDPSVWVDVGLSGRKPAPGKKGVLLVRRIDGQLQKWYFSDTGVYAIAEVGLMIQGGISQPLPVV